MATRFYLPSNTIPVVNPSPPAGWGSTTGFQRRKLDIAKEGVAFSNSATVTLPNTAGTSAPGANALMRQYVSDALAAQTISTSVTLSAQAMAKEINASHNIDAARTAIYVVSADGLTVRGTLLAHGQYGTTGNEWAASSFSTGSRNVRVITAGTACQNTVAVLEGDHLVYEIGGYTSAGGTGTPQCTHRVGDNNAADLPVDDTTTTDGAAWLELSSTVSLSSATPRFINVGSFAVGTTSVAPTCPPGLVAGDVMLLFVVSKYPTNGPSTPAGWTLAGQASGGAGAAGADSGTVYSTVYYKQSDGTESGSTVTVTIPSGDSACAAIYSFRKTSSLVWSVTTTPASVNTASTAWSATGAADLSLAPTDLLIVASAINTDGVRFSAHSLGATGCTFGQIAERLDFGTTNGDDCAALIVMSAVESGASSAAPTYTATGDSGSPAGSTLFVRLREQPVQASANITLGAATVAATATAPEVAAAAITLADASLAASAQVLAVAEVAVTLGDATLAAEARAAATAAAAVALDAATLSAAAIAPATATAGVPLEAATLVSLGKAPAAAAAAVTLQAATVTAGTLVFDHAYAIDIVLAPSTGLNRTQAPCASLDLIVRAT